MTPTKAVTTCLLSKYATFRGRASRSEFWWFAAFLVLVGAVIAAAFPVVAARHPALVPLAALFAFGAQLLLAVPSLAVSARRLHDVRRSGWWLLLLLVPLAGPLVLLVFFAQPGKVGDNRYGHDPVEEEELMRLLSA